MKKIALIILTMITIPTYAGTTMCAANDTVTVVLDPSVGDVVLQNLLLPMWTAKTPYGTISGTSACLSSNHNKSNYQMVKNLYSPNEKGELKRVVGGERYGSYCWVKLTHPAVSSWVYYLDMGINCANHCPHYANEYFAFTKEEVRSAMFGSIEN